MTATEFVAAHAAWIAGTGAKPNGAEANLTGANLAWENLSGANLEGANLEGANLSRAMMVGAKLPPAPVIPDIHKAVYEAASRPCALNMRCWHSECGTAHCRAGWVVTLAGHEGLALEKQIGTNAAAALIYMASDPTLERIPNWLATNYNALADMKRLAERQV